MQQWDLGQSDGQPQAVFRGAVSKLDVGLSHDAVLLEGEGAWEEGLGDTWGGRRIFTDIFKLKMWVDMSNKNKVVKVLSIHYGAVILNHLKLLHILSV